jgi:acetyl-CoA synthetase
VPRDAPGIQKIEFAVAERYNASEILFDNLRKGGAAASRRPGTTPQLLT